MNLNIEGRQKELMILNTSILTDYDVFRYSKISVLEVRNLIRMFGFSSAIGHEPTAQIISMLLSIDCKVNRVPYKQEIDDLAIIFKLNGRPEEGKILSISEIEKIGYTWGLLQRLN